MVSTFKDKNYNFISLCPYFNAFKFQRNTYHKCAKFESVGFNTILKVVGKEFN